MTVKIMGNSIILLETKGLSERQLSFITRLANTRRSLIRLNINTFGTLNSLPWNWGRTRIHFDYATRRSGRSYISVKTPLENRAIQTNQIGFTLIILIEPGIGTGEESFLISYKVIGRYGVNYPATWVPTCGNANFSRHIKSVFTHIILLTKMYIRQPSVKYTLTQALKL